MRQLARATEPELMDEHDQDTGDLTRSLGDLRVVNQWLGGTRVIVRTLCRMLRRLPRGRYRVLDVATGSADIPLVLAREGRAMGYPLEIVATDVHPHTVSVARAHTAGDSSIRVETADALDLPYPDGHFDFALCNTALHHFDDDDASQVLRELGRVAARGVVVGDLRRSRPGLWGARLLARTLWRNSRLTRNDGPLSVRRAFTVPELREIAGAAGLHDAVVRRHPLFRLSLVVDRTRG